MKKITIIIISLAIYQYNLADIEEVNPATLTIQSQNADVQKAFQTNKERFKVLNVLAQKVEEALINNSQYTQAVQTLQDKQEEFAEQSKKKIAQLESTQLNIKEPETPLTQISCREKTITISGKPGYPIIIRGKNLAGCDFSGVTFQNVIFSNVDLRGVNFRMAYFENVTFKDGTDLTGAFFEGSTFNDVHFGTDGKMVYMHFATFMLSTFQNTHFVNVFLQGANFGGSSFGLPEENSRNSISFTSSIVEQVDFTESDFNNVNFDSDCSLANSFFVNISGTRLTFGLDNDDASQPASIESTQKIERDTDTTEPDQNDEQDDEELATEGAGESQPNLHMTNFNNAHIVGKLIFFGNEGAPLNLIGASSTGATTENVYFRNIYYDAPNLFCPGLNCKCPKNMCMRDFMQAIKKLCALDVAHVKAMCPSSAHVKVKNS